MSRKVRLGQVRSGYISLLQVNSSLFRLGLVSSGEVRLCHVKKDCQFRSCSFRLLKVNSGYMRLDNVMSG
jgi:hypothetical protein